MIEPDGIYVIPNIKFNHQPEIKTFKVENNDELHMNKINGSIGKNDTLKLKRNKPLKRNQNENDLEQSLGIIRSSQPQA